MYPYSSFQFINLWFLSERRRLSEFDSLPALEGGALRLVQRNRPALGEPSIPIPTRNGAEPGDYGTVPFSDNDPEKHRSVDG